MDNKEKLEKFFNLHKFISNTVFPDGYSPNVIFGKILSPSKHAIEILDADSNLRDSYAPADLMLAMLSYFVHHDILIDLDESDIDKAIEIYSDELLSKKVRLPYRFGRSLYDKFNDTAHDERTDHIESVAVGQLLDGTEQGVYQVGTLLSGPLGLKQVPEARYIPPSGRLPLWHCSDTGCSAIHRVDLLKPRIPIVAATEHLARIADRAFGPASEWMGVLTDLHRHERWAKGKPYYDITTLIGDALVSEERTLIVAQALRGPKNVFLRSIPQPSPHFENSQKAEAITPVSERRAVG
jgi:hypothetical protein